MRRIVPVVLMLTIFVALPVQAQQHAHTVAMPETLKWVEPGTLPGTRLAVVQGDPSKERLFVYRLRMPAGYQIPPHFHKASENVTVLSGVFSVGVGRSSIRARVRSCRPADSSRSRQTTRTLPGRVVRRPSCRCTGWGRPISRS